MSYFDQSENSDYGYSQQFVLTPMAADIVAMQTLYGLSTTTRTGNTTYGYHSNAGGIFDAGVYPAAAYAIFDNGGIDTLDFSGCSFSQRINLTSETFSTSTATIWTSISLVASPSRTRSGVRATTPSPRTA